MDGGSWECWAEDELTEIRSAGRWRENRSFDAHGPSGQLAGADVVSFASNDYLGLSVHPAVAAAAHEAIDRWGTGSTSARLIVGTRPCHQDLEAAIAAWKGVERALVFPTGYQANVGVLGTLGGPDVTVFSDELNHASIIDGCRLGRSQVAVYRHNDLAHLDRGLAATGGRTIVVSDSVFSMDGDAADVDALAELCRRHGALLVVDEAHAVLGPAGPVARPGLDVIRVGTMSKTLGSMGGWVAASANLIDLLVNRARSFIFTTGLSPADCAASLAALAVVQSSEGDELRAHLRRLVDLVQPGHPSPIIPVVLGEEAVAVAAAQDLTAMGLFVPAIRPPTVPPGTSRLRVSLSAAHTEAMVGRLVAALEELDIAVPR